MKIKWAEAQNLLQEGDILLFKAKKSIFSLSYWISLYTRSEYSHVSLVSLENGVECLEFKEFIGSRQHPLIEEINRGAEIDVFRVYREFQAVKIDSTTGNVYTQKYEFNPETAKCITGYAKKLIGQKLGYSWSIIAHIILLFVPFFRLIDYNTKEIENNNYVCSTLIAKAYRSCFIDLVPYLPDHYTTPGHIAQSGLIYYVFSIEK